MKIDIEKINRIEIINRVKNDKPIGRLLTLYKDLGHFGSLDFEIQDNHKTLKIFLNQNKEDERIGIKREDS